MTTYQNRSQPARTSTETKLRTGSWHCLLHYTLVRASLPSPLTGFVCSGYVMVEVGRKEIPFWAQRGTTDLFGDYTGALGYITVGPQKLIPQPGLMEVYQIRTDLREDKQPTSGNGNFPRWRKAQIHTNKSNFETGTEAGAGKAPVRLSAQDRLSSRSLGSHAPHGKV